MSGKKGGGRQPRRKPQERERSSTTTSSENEEKGVWILWADLPSDGCKIKATDVDPFGDVFQLRERIKKKAEDADMMNFLPEKWVVAKLDGTIIQETKIVRDYWKNEDHIKIVEVSCGSEQLDLYWLGSWLLHKLWSPSSDLSLTYNKKPSIDKKSCSRKQKSVEDLQNDSPMPLFRLLLCYCGYFSFLSISLQANSNIIDLESNNDEKKTSAWMQYWSTIILALTGASLCTLGFTAAWIKVFERNFYIYLS